MQSKTSRIALLVAALAVAVVAFVVLSPGGDDGDPAPAQQAGQTEPEEQAAGSETPDGGGDGGGSEPEREPEEPEVPEIEIRNGELVGGVEEIEVERGDRIEFTVESDAPEEIHVHGYEITEQVGPGEPARLSFSADIEGIYEVEAHDIGHVVIAELRVTPS